VQEIANAISREDAKWLTTLPGIGATTAEQIVTTLKRKVTKLVFATDRPDASSGAVNVPAGKQQVIEDVYMGLMGLGLSPIEARTRLDQLIQSGKDFADAAEAINIIFSKG